MTPSLTARVQGHATLPEMAVEPRSEAEDMAAAAEEEAGPTELALLRPMLRLLATPRLGGADDRGGGALSEEAGLEEAAVTEEAGKEDE